MIKKAIMIINKINQNSPFIVSITNSIEPQMSLSNAINQVIYLCSLNELNIIFKRFKMSSAAFDFVLLSKA